MVKKYLLVLPTILSLCSSSLSLSCTTIFSNNNSKAMVVARSVDLYVSDKPMIKIMPRGTLQNGQLGENSLQWKSKYGSVIVTAFRSYAVSDGMNEKGFAAHILYLSESEYPSQNSDRTQISNLMWAQYMLDHFANVNEALAATKDLEVIATQIAGKTWPIHLTIEDRTGDSAIIEFIKGKMKVYHGKQFRVMTNEPAYHIQLTNLKRYQGFGGELSLPGDPDPLSRFVRASSFLKTLPKSANDIEAVANVLSVMRTVMVPFGAQDTSGNKTEDAWATRWVSVANLTNNIYYFNSTSTPNIVWVDLNKINFTEGNPSLSIDPINLQLNGDITVQFKPA